MSKKSDKVPILVVSNEIVQVGLGRVYKPEVMPCKQLHWYVPGTKWVPMGNSSKHYLKLFYGDNAYVEIVSKVESIGEEVYLRIQGDQELIPEYFLNFYKDCFLECYVYKTVPLRTFQKAKKNVKQLLGI